MKEGSVRSYLMTWIPKLRRWVKRYRGQQYTISCRQLGCEETREASWKQANAWWKARKEEVDKTNCPPKPGSAEAIAAILSAWGGPETTQAEALIHFMGYFADKPRVGVVQCLGHRQNIPKCN